MTRTLGAAVGALIMVLFLAHIASRLANPVPAQSISSARHTSSR